MGSLGRGRGERAGGIGFLGRGKGRGKRRAGPVWAENELGGKKGFSIFEKNDSNTFNLNSNSKEFKFKLNTTNKTMQCGKKMQHKRTTLFNLENNQHIFYFTLNSL